MMRYVSENNLSGFVKFKGWLSKEEMIYEYQSAQICVVTSLFEGMSISLLEAMACGCYIISTPLSGSSELITDRANGHIVNFKSAEEIARELERVSAIIPKDRACVIPDHILQDYSWDAIVKKYQKCFTEISAE
jgi:glycosyltransferase involved in cell wall biosynthesis